MNDFGCDICGSNANYETHSRLCPSCGAIRDKDFYLSGFKEGWEAAKKQAIKICEQHDDWRWLMETYPKVIQGAGCQEAHGASLCATAINVMGMKDE